ncbi:MAG: HEAT repeat domain-containing protein [Myxococcales bacterium]
MAETRGGTERAETERAPAAPELLRAAMEKVVFFEWRLGEMAAELAAAQSRASAAELERARVAQQRSEAEREADAARQHVHALEAERERLSSLLARPPHLAAESAAAQAERARAAALAAELAEARGEIERQRAERDRWLDERLSQALGSGDSEGSLASFISELRGEVIALRERQKQCDELLRQAGIVAPAAASRPPPPIAPRRDLFEEARALWTQSRRAAPADSGDTIRNSGADSGDTIRNSVHGGRVAYGVPGSHGGRVAYGVPGSDGVPGSRGPRGGAAATALAEQCLRGLSARDPARREQAARHLAAMPVPAAAPALASALAAESDIRARSQMAVALVACGGPAAVDLVAELQSDPEPLVRLSALDGLCSLADRAAAALETASRDPSPAVRRRAAAISFALGSEEIRARFAMDADGSVREAASIRELPAPQQKPPPSPTVSGEAPARSRPPVRAVPGAAQAQARDLARDAVLAVQTAIFGMTESELANALSLPESEVPALVASLFSSGRLARRGKRLVAAGPGAAAQGGP